MRLKPSKEWMTQGWIQSIFGRLLIVMIALGVTVGVVFPFFSYALLDTDRALRPSFFVLCVLAGFLVGLANFWLFNLVVSRQLRRIAGAMGRVVRDVSSLDERDVIETDLLFDAQSRDAIGDIQLAFNDMTTAVVWRLGFETTLRGFQRRLSDTVDLDSMSATVLRILADTADAPAALLYVASEDAFVLTANIGVDRSNALPTTIGEQMGSVRRAIEEQAQLELDIEVHDLPWLKQSTPIGTFRPSRVVILPLVVKRRVIALAVLASSGAVAKEAKGHLTLLADHAGTYLQNALLHQRVQDLAAMDELTGVPNRRFGQERFNETVAQTSRDGSTFSVLVVDIDHFKAFNDTFGHEAGDVVLREFATTIALRLRARDVVYRYGGEEFVMILPDTDLNGAVVVAERLRRNVEALRVRWQDQDLKVTASIGVADWARVEIDAPEDLIASADRALYAAKEAGRNRVFVVHEEGTLPASSLPESDATAN